MYKLMLLGIALVYFLVVGVLLYRGKTTKKRLVILAWALLIPYADESVYRVGLAYYCKYEAGYWIHEHLSKKEGLLSLEYPHNDNSFLRSDNFAQDTPVAFMESARHEPNPKGGRVAIPWRADRLADGTGSEPYDIEAYTAKYQIIKNETKHGPLIAHGFQILRRSDQKIMSEYKNMSFMGGWYPRVTIRCWVVKATMSSMKMATP